MDKITLTELIDASMLQKIQDAFSKYTKMAALITDADGVPITNGSNFSRFCTDLVRKSELGCKRCEECDRDGALETLKNGRPTVYKCHAGLTDYASPIMLQGRFIGSFIGGQIRMCEIDEDEMRRTAKKYKIDGDEYVKAAQETPIIPFEDIERAAVFLSELTETISDMAYKNYTALEQSRRLENAARSQANFIMSLSAEIHKNISNWTEDISSALKSDEHEMLRETMKGLIGKSKDLGAAVGDTVDYMHMAGGDFELTEKIYNVREVVEKNVASFDSFAREKGSNTEIVIEKNVPDMLFGDSGRIGQIINKLVENGIRFTWNGKVTIRVSCYKDLYADMLVISVKDNGIGLEKEDLENVRKYLCDNNMSVMKNQDALVPGFSIIGFLARQLAGTIEINSTVGKGSEFTVILPQLSVDGGGAG